jgi:hypothetical protein
VFCGKPARSHEHAWPEWLLKSVGHDVDGRIEATFGIDADTHRWTNRPITVKTVCGECNSGWMCSLEGAVRPLIGAMAADLSVSLNAEEQFKIALWGVKTAIVFGSSATTRMVLQRRRTRCGPGRENTARHKCVDRSSRAESKAPDGGAAPA